MVTLKKVNAELIENGEIDVGELVVLFIYTVLLSPTDWQTDKWCIITGKISPKAQIINFKILVIIVAIPSELGLPSSVIMVLITLKYVYEYISI